MIFRSMKISELDHWTELCNAGFNVPAQYFKNHYVNDPYADPDGVFVAEDNGKLCSSVRVFTRSIYLCGEEISMGGIGEVTTLPEYRKQGLSTQLLRAAVNYMESKELNTSFLFTGTNHHYAHMGWCTVPRRRLSASVIECDISGFTVKNGSEFDIEFFSSLYDTFAPRYNGVIARKPEYWAKWINRSVFDVLCENGKPVAFSRFWKGDEGLSFNEYIGDVKYLKPFILIEAEGKTRVIMPAAYADKAQGFDYSEAMGLMVRLNSSFDCAGKKIADTEQLSALLTGGLWFGEDSF